MVGRSYKVVPFVAAAEIFSGTVNISGDGVCLSTICEAPDATAGRTCHDKTAYAKHVLESIACCFLALSNQQSVALTVVRKNYY